MWPVALLGAGVALAYASTRGVANVKEVKSERDGKIYHVQDLPDKKEAVAKLSEVCDNLDKIMDKYRGDPATANDPRVKVLLERYNRDNIFENDVKADSTSYSENKGDKIVICLRDKAPPYKLVDTNTIMFVVLHEMAHLMTTTIGHTPEFWTNFKRLLQDAVSVGVYQAQNYDRTPVQYCGMTISSSPI
jgi:hypothetical protein